MIIGVSEAFNAEWSPFKVSLELKISSEWHGMRLAATIHKLQKCFDVQIDWNGDMMKITNELGCYFSTHIAHLKGKLSKSTPYRDVLM